MRIAQIAPLTESVPPRTYGGTERVVSYLTEELMAMGHDVTLFASGDSVTSAKLEAAWPCALRFDTTLRDAMAPQMLLMEKVYQQAHEFDVLHCHLDYWPFSLLSRQATPYMTTLHGRLDLPELTRDLRLLRGRAAGFDLRRAAPAAAARQLHRHGASWPAAGPADAAAGPARLPGVPRPHLPGKIARPRDPHRSGRRHEAEDRRQGRPCRSRVFRNDDPADDRWRSDRNDRRDRRRREAGVPERRQGVAAADRLAGAVRPGDDRGDGLRHADHRVPRRFGAGGHRPRRHRLHRA